MTLLHVICGFGPQSKILATPTFKTLHFGLNFENLTQVKGEARYIAYYNILVVNYKLLEELPREIFVLQKKTVLGVIVQNV